MDPLLREKYVGIIFIDLFVYVRTICMYISIYQGMQNTKIDVFKIPKLKIYPASIWIN